MDSSQNDEIIDLSDKTTISTRDGSESENEETTNSIIVKVDELNIHQEPIAAASTTVTETSVVAINTVISNTTTPTSSTSSIQLTSSITSHNSDRSSTSSSNSSSSSSSSGITNTSSNNVLLNDYKLQFCSSNSSLNTSFYEMNQAIDLTKNEYFSKTTLNSPNKFYNLNHNVQLDVDRHDDANGEVNEANIMYMNDKNNNNNTINGDDNENLLKPQEQLRRSVRIAHMYNNKINGYQHTPPSATTTTTTTSDDVLDDTNSAVVTAIEFLLQNDSILTTNASINDEITKTTTSSSSIDSTNSIISKQQQQQQENNSNFNGYDDEFFQTHNFIHGYNNDASLTLQTKRTSIDIIENNNDQIRNGSEGLLLMNAIALDTTNNLNINSNDISNNCYSSFNNNGDVYLNIQQLNQKFIDDNCSNANLVDGTVVNGVATMATNDNDDNIHLYTHGDIGLTNSMLNNFSNCNQLNAFLDRNYNNYEFIHKEIHTKQDVSIGTDLSISRDLKVKKDFNPIENLRLKRPSEKESFKLVEKVQPKKSRTKYTKDQIEVLENAYTRNPYPDLVTVEQLCKILDITRDKVNIWFQNRRARTKRNNKIIQDNNTLNANNNSSRITNGYVKLIQTYQPQKQQQQTQIIYNMSTPYYTTSTTQSYIQRLPTVTSTENSTMSNYPMYSTNSNTLFSNGIVDTNGNKAVSSSSSYCLDAGNYTQLNNTINEHIGNNNNCSKNDDQIIDNMQLLVRETSIHDASITTDSNNVVL